MTFIQIESSRAKKRCMENGLTTAYKYQCRKTTRGVQSATSQRHSFCHNEPREELVKDFVGSLLARNVKTCRKRSRGTEEPNDHECPQSQNLPPGSPRPRRP